MSRSVALSNYVLAMEQFAVMQSMDLSYFLRREVLDALRPEEIAELRSKFPSHELLFEGNATGQEVNQFTGNFLRVTTEHRPDGSLAERVYVRDGVSIIAIRENGDIWFIKEEDFHTGIVRTKLPSGYFEPGEDPLTCAQRELKEETGYTADEWELYVHSTTEGPVRKIQYYFVAKKLHEGVASPDSGEKIFSGTFLNQRYVQLCALNGTFGTTSTAYALLKLTTI